ncbi:MAG TPA: hypothetical protein VGK72_04555, partial [Chthoniobacterales bacterium]
FRGKLIDQTVLVMNPDYGARLQLQKIVMLDVADIVVVNKTDLDRAKVALSEIEYRLTQNKRGQQLVATVAKRHRDAGVDKLYEMLTEPVISSAVEGSRGKSFKVTSRDASNPPRFARNDGKGKGQTKSKRKTIK